MSHLLLIDTAVNAASVALTSDKKILAQKENTRQNDHAAWLHPAIQSLFEETGISIRQLDAVGVTAGPGSYTGLRVGMAAAKGFCFAQNIPLISISTLQLLAAGVQEDATDLIIALIDARRDEVYAGVYDRDLRPVVEEQAMILGTDSFQSWREKNHVIYTGDGAAKIERLIGIKQFPLYTAKNLIGKLAGLTYEKFQRSEFSNLAYLEPTYLKEFHQAPKDK